MPFCPSIILDNMQFIWEFQKITFDYIISQLLRDMEPWFIAIYTVHFVYLVWNPKTILFKTRIVAFPHTFYMVTGDT